MHSVRPCGRDVNPFQLACSRPTALKCHSYRTCTICHCRTAVAAAAAAGAAAEIRLRGTTVSTLPAKRSSGIRAPFLNMFLKTKKKLRATTVFKLICTIQFNSLISYYEASQRTFPQPPFYHCHCFFSTFYRKSTLYSPPEFQIEL